MGMAILFLVITFGLQKKQSNTGQQHEPAID